MDIAYIHEKVHAIVVICPWDGWNTVMKGYLFPWINISYMDAADPWVPCNIALQRCLFNTTGSKSGIVAILALVALTSTDNLLRIEVIGSVQCIMPSSLKHSELIIGIIMSHLASCVCDTIIPLIDDNSSKAGSLKYSDPSSTLVSRNYVRHFCNALSVTSFSCAIEGAIRSPCHWTPFARRTNAHHANLANVPHISGIDWADFQRHSHRNMFEGNVIGANFTNRLHDQGTQERGFGASPKVVDPTL